MKLFENRKKQMQGICRTSLTVYPAAFYINYFKGENLVIINETETSRDNKATLVIRERFADVMKGVMDILKRIIFMIKNIINMTK